MDIILPRACALTNQIEYFAELSTMYFACCKCTPAGRDVLRQYDPTGYAMIGKMWGVAGDR